MLNSGIIVKERKTKWKLNIHVIERGEGKSGCDEFPNLWRCALCIKYFTWSEMKAQVP